MPVERIPLSSSQLAELLGVEPQRLIDIQKRREGFAIIIEPEDRMTQTTGAFPQLTKGGKKIGGSKGGKKGC